MRDNLGELIRQARLQRGWDQSELARQLSGVGQQAVSRWERGLSRPRLGVLAQLAGLLDLPESSLLAAGGYLSAEAAGVADSPPPVRTRMATLPFHLLSGETFERFSVSLARSIFPDAKVARNGGSGSAQDGADVIATTHDGELIAIQCKQVREFGPARVQAVVTEMRLPADRCYLFLSRTASPAARQEIARHPRWQLWDASDLSDAVRSLRDQDSAIRLVETYFGDSYRELFLGLPEPGPWRTSSDFFRADTGGRIYSHGWKLVGRAGELASMTAFLDDSEHAVAMLVGRGGVGKSRLLRELAAVAEEPGRGVRTRFLARNATARARTFEFLPADGRLLVIIDDAHDRGRLGDVIRDILRARPDARVLLSLRPAGRAQLLADLRAIGLHQSEVPEWRLEDLGFAAAEALAAEVLGPDASGALTRQLAALAPDCPLLIVVGGALIRSGQLNPARLASGTGFRDEIMTTFRETVAMNGAITGSQERQEVLNGIAALQPFRIDQPAFRSALAELTGRPFDQLMPQIRLLEEAAVLVRRSQSLRIAPNLLGDVILVQTAVDVSSGSSTGYLERVAACADGECLLHVFANASRTDWQVRTGHRVGLDIVESMWPVISGRFRAGDPATRLRLLEVLRDVAFFLPKRTIDLVRWTMRNLVQVGGAGGQHVLQALPGVLENAAYNRDYLRDAADLLWELAGQDARSPNQHPGHPIRILQGLVEYNVSKSIDFHHLLIDAATSWLRNPASADSLYSPFEVLKPLLATAVTAFMPDRLMVMIRTYPVTAAAVQELRSRVLDLAFAEARSPDPRRAAAAVEAIGASIRYEDPADDAEREQWAPLFIATIERIGDQLADSDLDPVVSITVRQALWWHLQYSQAGTKPAAAEAWNRLPQSAHHTVALALHDGWGHLVPHGSDAAGSERARNAALGKAVTKAIETWPDDARLTDQIEERLAADRRAFPGSHRGSPQPFIKMLAGARPGVARIICERVAQNPGGILEEVLPAALSQLAETLPGEAISQAHDLLATQEGGVTRRIAEALGYARGSRADLLDGEEGLLRRLLASDDADARRLAVAAVIALARTSRALALDLVTSVRFADSPGVADAVAAAFGPHSNLSWSDLPSQQADQILDQLRACPTIDSYEITTLLSEISASQPDLVLALLTDRVLAWEDHGPSRSGYLPLPSTWHARPAFKAHGNYPALLRKVRDWIAADSRSLARRVMGAEIFATVADDFDEQATATILDAIEADDTAQVEAAIAIMREAPPGLAWDVQFVTQVLNAATRHGNAYGEAAGRSLLSAAINGSSPITLGQNDPEHDGRQDDLARILNQVPQGSITDRFYQSLAGWHDGLMNPLTEDDTT